MPGIVGIIKKGSIKKTKKELKLMLNTMIHEDFYRYGMHMDESLGAYIGWVCQKGSFTDSMPISNEKGDCVLIFAGENYADKDIINKLKSRRHQIGDSKRADYLVHLYEEEGIGFIRKLNGWFSGAILDSKNQNIIIFNDRYGMQRLYYFETKDEFLFSSEAKAILKVRPKVRHINLESLEEFFTYGCVLDNRSLFSNIFLLPGASTWIFRNGDCIRKEKYFRSVEWENQDTLNTDLYYDKLRETLEVILQRYFTNAQEVGISLTGGLDTRIILAYIDKYVSTIPCYTFSSMYRENFDVSIARDIAKTREYPHKILRLGKGFLDNFAKNAEKTIFVTDGCADICCSHEIYLNKMAREIAKIRITGNFGSEVLRKMSTFKANNLCQDLFSKNLQFYLKTKNNKISYFKRKHQLSFTLFKEIPWNMYGCLAAAQSQLTVRTPFMDNDFIKVLYQGPPGSRDSNEISIRLITENDLLLSTIRTDRGIRGKSNNFSSILTRLWYNFLFKTEYYYSYGMPQWLSEFNYFFGFLGIEKMFIGRHKLEHYRIWFRDKLSNYIREIILDRQTASRGYFNKDFLEYMVSRHIRGDRNYTNEINKTIAIELIHRLLIDNL